MKKNKKQINKQSNEGVGGMGVKESPKQQKKTERYMSSLASLVHNGKTKDAIYEALQSTSPDKSIPATALQINEKVESAVREKGGKPALTTMFNSMLFLTTELATIGQEGGFFQLSREDVIPIYENTLKQYIQKGLKDRTIDPIELQKTAESYMTPEQRQQGLALAKENGVSQEAGSMAAMEMYADQRVQKERGVFQRKADAELQQQQQQRQAGPGSQQPRQAQEQEG